MSFLLYNNTLKKPSNILNVNMNFTHIYMYINSIFKYSSIYTQCNHEFLTCTQCTHVLNVHMNYTHVCSYT